MAGFIVLEGKKHRIKIRMLHDACPETCAAIEQALPVEIAMSRWGDELYGSVDIEAGPENPREECEVGDVAYWLDGPAICLLFGRTPASRGPKPRLISPGNVFGKMEDVDFEELKKFDSFHGRLVKGK